MAVALKFIVSVVVGRGERRFARSFLLAADGVAEARVEGMRRMPNVDFEPHVEIDVSVLGDEELRDVVPDVKAIARAYWEAGRACESDDAAEFFALWEEHGPSTSFD